MLEFTAKFTIVVLLCRIKFLNPSCRNVLLKEKTKLEKHTFNWWHTSRIHELMETWTFCIRCQDTYWGWYQVFKNDKKQLITHKRHKYWVLWKHDKVETTMSAIDPFILKKLSWFQSQVCWAEIVFLMSIFSKITLKRVDRITLSCGGNAYCWLRFLES